MSTPVIAPVSWPVVLVGNMLYYCYPLLFQHLRVSLTLHHKWFIMDGSTLPGLHTPSNSKCFFLDKRLIYVAICKCLSEEMVETFTPFSSLDFHSITPWNLVAVHYLDVHNLLLTQIPQKKVLVQMHQDLKWQESAAGHGHKYFATTLSFSYHKVSCEDLHHFHCCCSTGNYNRKQHCEAMYWYFLHCGLVKRWL